MDCTRRKRLLLLRGLLGFGAVSSYYGTVQYLPLGDTAVLMFLAPLFVAAASPLLLKELPSRGVWVALPLSVVGVVLVAQPSFIFGGAQALSALGVALGVLQVSSVCRSARAAGWAGEGRSTPHCCCTVLAAFLPQNLLGHRVFCTTLSRPPCHPLPPLLHRPHSRPPPRCASAPWDPQSRWL